RTLVSAGSDQVITWDVAGRSVAASRGLDEDRLAARTVSADGVRLAECAFDGRITVTDITTGRPVRDFDAGRRLMALALAPDGKTLVGAEASALQLTADPKPIRRWDVTIGAAQPPLDPGAVPTRRLFFSPDGRRLVGTDVG